MIKRGDVVRAPWRQYGDDKDLTGEVLRVRAGQATVRWNADGDVTPAGDESTIPVAQLEKVDA